jgi:hypothetical protein
MTSVDLSMPKARGDLMTIPHKQQRLLLGSVLALGLAGCGPRVISSTDSETDGQTSAMGEDTLTTSMSSTTSPMTPTPEEPCEATEDCPPDQTCVAGACSLEPPPELYILSPELEHAFRVQGDPVIITVAVSGEHLSLVDPSSDPNAEFGRGNVVLYLDGQEVAVLSAGDLETGVAVEVSVPPVSGAHRLVAKARFSNDTFYDNEGGEARQFFWLDDGKPHVGFIHPFPGDVYGLESTEVPFTVAALNFSFVTPEPSNSRPGHGHAHVHYNRTFPACAFDYACHGLYMGVIAPENPASSATSVATMAASVPGEAKLTASLEEINHFAYLDEDGQPVWEDISIQRADSGKP